MSMIKKLQEKWKARREEIVILTPWGKVSETARAQAAANMKADPMKRASVEALLAKQLGSVAAGLAESRRRYPESYSNDEVN